jgi:transcriptional regulator with GAF, ATPase, and Fis domain
VRVRRPRLRILGGPQQGEVVDIDDRGVVIGTQPPADLLLTDGRASRRHAEIRRAPSGFVLHDLGSTNGTYLADLRIGSVYLGEGCVFRIGETEISFEDPEVALSLTPDARAAPLDMVAVSAKMRELVAAVRTFGPTDLSVIVEGETGVGKEVVARAIHELSRRAARPLVVVDCGALQEQLTESELFGHERGAFTGAVEARAGAFETADGGTIFLDEIGELPLSLQPKLLRALEAREIRRLGSNRTRTTDVRVIAATHRDLPEEVAGRTFRADLFFRLSEVRLKVPALRERPEDILPLAERFARESDPALRFDRSAAEELGIRSWPGNARELRNTVRRAAVVAQGGTIRAAHIAPVDFPGDAGRPSGPSVDVDVGLPIVDARDGVLASFHRVYLQALLDRYGGDMGAMARHAGIELNSVHRLLRKAGLK